MIATRTASTDFVIYFVNSDNAGTAGDFAGQARMCLRHLIKSFSQLTMTVIFDVFTKKTRLYYTAEIVSILTLLLIAWGGVFNPQVNPAFDTIIEVFLIIGSLTMVSFIIIATSGWVRVYIKDGELILTDGYILIDGTKISLNETTAINLKVATTYRKRLGNLISNRIEVIDKNRKIYKNRFVINSSDHGEELERLLDQWRTNGVAFNLRYHGV